MSIESIIAERNITEVQHFTTNNGIAGILAARALKARDLLTSNEYLEHLTLLNCPDRSRDVDWHGYANLSLSRIWPFGDLAQRL